ncbi:MAG: YrdB family protein [Chloroflexi bacterium]|nr:YrdB family protein [Chloroflexota bacterium]
MFKMVNLGIHFLLEIAALVAVGYWGFKTGSAAESKALLGVGLPLLLAAVWGVFRVPNDPGPAVVAVPGWLRMIIEFGVFAFAVWCLAAAGRPSLAWAFGILSILNYAGMYSRLIGLLSR